MRTDAHPQDLKFFLSLSGDNLLRRLEAYPKTFEHFYQIDSHWLKVVLEGSPAHQDRATVCVLNAYAHNFFRSSLTLIFSGQPTSVYCLFRAALECAMYGLAIATDQTLELIWLKRNESEDHRKKCRNAFSPTKLFQILEARNRELSDMCKNLYELYIDYGAHPNVFGTFTFVRPAPDTDNAIQLGFVQGDGKEVRIAAF